MARKDLFTQLVIEPYWNADYAIKSKWFKTLLGKTKEGIWIYQPKWFSTRLGFVYYKPIRRYTAYVQRPVPKKIWAAYCAEELMR